MSYYKNKIMPVIQNKKLNTKVVIKKIPDFEYGIIWEDPISGHKIGCLDVSKKEGKKQFLPFKIRRIMLI